MAGKKKTKGKTVITVTPAHKRRSPHKPTRAHRVRTRYSRKGRQRDRRRTELRDELAARAD